MDFLIWSQSKRALIFNYLGESNRLAEQYPKPTAYNAARNEPNLTHDGYRTLDYLHSEKPCLPCPTFPIQDCTRM